MHFKSDKTGKYRVFAVSGTNTVSFAIDFREADTKGLLGFAVERHDPKENERYFMYGMKVFKSVIPDSDERTVVTTFDHPVHMAQRLQKRRSFESDFHGPNSIL